MSNPTASFFEALGRRGHDERIPVGAAGTIRFDLADEQGIDRWFLVIDGDQVRTSREEGRADCVIHGTRATFDEIVRGRSRLYAAWVRNEIRLEGDLGLGALLQRLMPGQPGAHHPREFVRARRRAA